MNIILKVIKDNPQFHGSGFTSWAINEDILNEIQKHIKSDFKTLETGCGASTVLFAALGCNHICVTPSQDETQRVVDYINNIGYSADKVRFLIGSSDLILPSLPQDMRFDLVFIDGAHRFPFPILDFHYMEHLMNIGSVLVVDDIQIRAVAMLNEYLTAEDEWAKICIVGNTAFYKKIAEPRSELDWIGQKLNSVSKVIMWQRRIYAKLIRITKLK